MPINEKQRQRIEGILRHLDDFLDKRFAQARRIHPPLANVESDMRITQRQTMFEVLAGLKGFGPIRIMVGDILASSDAAKKIDLFNLVNQVCIFNEIIPDEADASASATGVILKVTDIATFYEALDPTLGRILNLLQTWIWWDLRDAAELYRFDMQEIRIQQLSSIELDQNMQEAYRQEMGGKRGEGVTKEAVLEFEIDRTLEIVDLFESRLHEEPGYQKILVVRERHGNPESDAACIALAKRLTTIEKLQAQQEGELDDAVRRFYAPLLGVTPDKVTTEAIIRHEIAQAGRDREHLTEQLNTAGGGGAVKNYKETHLESLRTRLKAIQASLAPAPAPAPPPQTPQPAAQG